MRPGIVYALGGFREASAKAVPKLIQVLRHDDNWAARSSAASALAEIGPAACCAIPELKHALVDEEPQVRIEAAYSLFLLDGGSLEGLDALICGLTDDDFYVRRNAAWTLNEIGSAAKDAIPALIKALKDPANQVARYAISALAKMGPAAKDAIPILMIIASDNANERYWDQSDTIAELAKEAIRIIEGAESSVSEEDDTENE